MARPTKLDKDLITEAKQYLEDCEGDRKPLPTVEGLALRLKVHKDTLYEWAKLPETDEEDTELKREFSDVFSDLKNAQAEKLMQLSLKNQYNAMISKMILSGKHGYVEKSEVDQNVSGNVSFVNDVPRPGKGDATDKST